MSLTLITNEVVALSSIGPENLSFGAPQWNASGVLSATKFIGDGSGLTNVFPGLSVVEVTDTFFEITPDHNNAVLALNNSSDILLDLDFIGTYVEGHKTTLVQVNQGEGIVGFPVYNSSGFDRTRGIYSVGTLLYGGFSNGWTLYGDLTSSGVTPPAPAPSLSGVNFTQIAAGHYHSLALSGTDLYATGFNNVGQLGLGNADSKSIFTKVNLPTNAKWSAVSSGNAHSLALSGTDLYATGWNQYGQLGIGDQISRVTFTKIPGNWSLARTSNFGEFSLALSGDTLYMTGRNDHGELGLGDNVQRATFTNVPGKWSQAVGGDRMCFALSGTDLYATGYNLYGQLGIGTKIDKSSFTKVTVPANAKWTSVVAGYWHTFALSGTDLYAVGYNVYGQLGLGNQGHVSTFTKVPGNWTSVFGGWNYSFALSGTDLYGAGDNSYGQLGLGDTAFRSTFTKILGKWTATGDLGLSHTLMLSGATSLGTGRNIYGQLGLGDTTNRSTFTQVTAVSL